MHELVGIQFVLAPGAVQGGHLEPRESERPVIVQLVQRRDGSATRDFDIEVCKVIRTLTDYREHPVEIDLGAAGRTGDSFRV